MYELKQEADKALIEAKDSPEQAPNIYKRYSNALQKRMLQKKEQAKAITKDKKVNIAMTQEDSIFPNVKLPGGISSKATEYKELARKGEKWESPIFSIGSASKSTDIPAVPKVERKAHSVTHSNGHGTGVGNGAGNGVGNGHGLHMNNMALNGAKIGNGKAPATGGTVGGLPTGQGLTAQGSLYEQSLSQPPTGALPGRF